MAEPLFTALELAQFVWVILAAGVIVTGTIGIIAAFVYRADK